MPLPPSVRLSKYLLSTTKDDPAEAEVVSHRLMLRACMIKQSSSGIYSWLPLGLRVLKKVENIVRSEMNKAGAIEILMPTIQPADLWIKSGRYENYGKEMLRIKDRHNRDLLYGPTNEEQITDIMQSYTKSYRSLPKILYHIQWKFRDEVRPRFGVMRGREFFMKDAYSFDIDKERSLKSYNKMFLAYLNIFSRLKLSALPMKAESGPIGGDYSHEFIILAKTGESLIYLDKRILNKKIEHKKYNYNANLDKLIEDWTSVYARTEDLHDSEVFNKEVTKTNQITARGIEVAHVFSFEDKYSKAFDFSVTDQNNKKKYLHMGSYGVGVSRLVAAIIEASHDERGIIWPLIVSPFSLAIVTVGSNSEEQNNLALKIIDTLDKNNIDSVYSDDPKDSFGNKLTNLELIGIPYIIIIGKEAKFDQQLEIRRRMDNATLNITLKELIKIIQNQQDQSDIQ